MNPTPFENDDLERLETLLGAAPFAGNVMCVDEIQAMLCAVVSAPRSVPPEEWLPEALGDALSLCSQEQSTEVIELLIRFSHDIAQNFLQGESIAPIVYPLEGDGDAYDYAVWADAYVFGCSLGGDWFEMAGKHAETLSELLEPLFMLNGMLQDDAKRSGERWFSPAEEARILADIEENLPEILQALYDFWRHKPVPAKRPENSVGRNDPCPCGSGKKFKQCCDNPEKLH